MTPAAIIVQAAAAGVSLTLSDTGAVMATGDRDAVAHWLPIIRAHKSELVAHLRYEAIPDYVFDEVMPSIRKYGCYPPPGAQTDLRELEALATQDTIADPAGPCPACGSGQWWQPREGGAWHCRHCDGDAMPLTATTLTLACHPDD